MSNSNGHRNMQLVLQSFGFKHGLPDNVDFVFDVRCLPNPYWQPELSNFNGLDPVVQEYFSKEALVTKMLEDLFNFLSEWIPKFSNSERSKITVVIGCTGGVHRSVYIVEQLAIRLKLLLDDVVVRHREL